MTFAEFSLVRFGTGLSPHHAGAENADLLMQSLRDDAVVTRYPALSTPEASRLAYDFAQAGRAVQKMGNDSPEYTAAKAALDAAKAQAAAAHALVAALQVVDAVEHLAPQAVALGRRVVRLALAQPGVQAQQLLEVPQQVGAEADGQGPGVLARDQADQAAGGQQQQQAARQGAAQKP